MSKNETEHNNIINKLKKKTIGVLKNKRGTNPLF